MIYLFSVTDNTEAELKVSVFSIEADSKETAEEIFVQKAITILPVPITYELFVQMLYSYDIVVSFLGEKDNIIKL